MQAQVSPGSISNKRPSYLWLHTGMRVFKCVRLFDKHQYSMTVYGTKLVCVAHKVKANSKMSSDHSLWCFSPCMSLADTLSLLISNDCSSTFTEQFTCQEEGHKLTSGTNIVPPALWANFDLWMRPAMTI